MEFLQMLECLFCDSDLSFIPGIVEVVLDAQPVLDVVELWLLVLETVLQVLRYVKRPVGARWLKETVGVNLPSHLFLELLPHKGSLLKLDVSLDGEQDKVGSQGEARLLP